MTTLPSTPLRSRALALLAKFYGYRSFRPGQFEIIEAVCAGRDAVVLMPTGGGKSICFQLPALLAENGVAIVVSPLIALMQDQTQALIANGIPAAAIHSHQSEEENRRILDAAFAGKIRLLYTSPERLNLELDRWARLRISLFAIDEAHCISQWGHDFRPDYTALGQIKERFPGTPVIALTATADRLTRDDIASQLNLRNPYCHLGSFDRPNITLRTFANAKKKQRMDYIAHLSRKYPQDSGIAYCISRKGAEDTHAALQAMGIPSVCYHAGMPAADRARSLRAFLDGAVRVCCATVAFGMGIDKSNIRWVVHNNLPPNIESYYQEIGRAGRDGLPAEAVLFHSLGDVITLEKFADDSGRRAINLEKLNRMRAFAETRVCRRRVLLSYFSEERTCDCGNCDNCIAPPERIDGTVLAQKAVSGVLRTGSRIGVFTLVGILRGQMRSDIRREGWDSLKTFGCGADLSQDEWNDYLRQMIQLGVFEMAYDDGNRLRVTDYGMRIVRGTDSLTLSAYVAPTTARGSRGKKAEPESYVPVDPTTQLFEQLKTVRTDIARTEGMPPDLVFSDATLMDMATRKPSTIDEMLAVNGVSEKKAVRFGRRFLGAIRKFMGLSAGTPQGTSLRETLILFNAGDTPAVIASTRNLKLNTILGHLAKLIDEDLITTYSRIITRQQYDDITTTLASGAPDAFETLSQRYESGLITIAQAVTRAIARKKASRT